LETVSTVSADSQTCSLSVLSSPLDPSVILAAVRAISPERVFRIEDLTTVTAFQLAARSMATFAHTFLIVLGIIRVLDLLGKLPLANVSHA
jgi:hypothetical protein